MQEHYQQYIASISEALDAATTKTITLLSADIKTCKLIGVSRETVEEVLKRHWIGTKILAKHSNVTWNILLAIDWGQEAGWQHSDHEGSLSSDRIYGHLQEEASSTQGAHEHHRGPSERVKASFQLMEKLKMSLISWAKWALSLAIFFSKQQWPAKAFWTSLIDFCGETIFVIVEWRRPHCWSCGATAHLSKAFLGMNQVLQPQPKLSTSKETVGEV